MTAFQVKSIIPGFEWDQVLMSNGQDIYVLTGSVNQDDWLADWLLASGEWVGCQYRVTIPEYDADFTDDSYPPDWDDDLHGGTDTGGAKLRDWREYLAWCAEQEDEPALPPGVLAGPDDWHAYNHPDG